MNLTRIVENLIRPPQQGHAEGPDSTVAEPGGGTGTVPIGSLKTLGGYVYQFDGRRWYNTGVRDEAAPKAQEAPQIEYDAQGRAFRWTTLNGQPVTAFLGAQFDRPDKAVGYRAPSAPRYPTTEVNNQTGDIFQSDGYGGMPVWVGNDPRLITDFTPGQTRANTLADLESSRRFTAGESEASRRFTAGENAASRAASREESDLSRALNAGQFAATLQAQRQRDEMAAEESYQNRMRQYGQDKIAGARTVAELTNSVDPTALPAFYRAGGGNIENAIQAGATAVSDRAVLPAAQALRGTREMAAPSRFTFAPLNIPTAPTASTNAGPYEKVMTNDEQAAELRRQLQPKAPPPLPVFTPDGGSVSPVDGASPLDRPDTPAFVKRYAFGTQGEPATGTFVTGDSENPDDPFAGGARPELNTVEDPPGPNNARVHVQPLAPPEEGGEMAKFGAVLRAIGAMLTGETETPAGPPRYAYGTGTYDPYAPIQPGDQPYLDEIRDIRTTAEYPELNPYATKYRFEAPTVRQAFLMGRQGRYGVPVIDQQAQIDRYQVPTASRGGFALGV